MKSGAEQQYATMTVDEICKLPVRDIADKNSVLFLWVTVPMLREGLQVMDAWGYHYKTALSWRKESFGLGYWFRGQMEHLLFGVRGKVKAFRMQECNFHQSKAGKHSAKPAHFREMIERTATKGELKGWVELFARGDAVPGWKNWGLEAIPPKEPPPPTTSVALAPVIEIFDAVGKVMEERVAA